MGAAEADWNYTTYVYAKYGRPDWWTTSCVSVLILIWNAQPGQAVQIPRNREIGGLEFLGASHLLYDRILPLRSSKHADLAYRERGELRAVNSPRRSTAAGFARLCIT